MLKQFYEVTHTVQKSLNGDDLTVSLSTKFSYRAASRFSPVSGSVSAQPRHGSEGFWYHSDPTV